MAKLNSNPSDLEQRLARLEAPAPGPGVADRLLSIPTEAEWHRPAPVRRWRPLLATLTAALTVAAGFGLVLSTSRPVPAFSQVEKALQEVRTATWRETSTSFGMLGNARFTRTTEVWVRTDPPAMFERKDNGSRTLLNQGGRRSFARGRYTRADFPPEWDLARQIILSHVTAPTTATPPNPSERWKGSPQTLDGKPTILFTREYRWGGDDMPYPLRQAVTHVRRAVQNVWVDPDTYWIVRTERRQFDTRDNRLESLTITEGYRYNEIPPAGTFTWKVPAGQTEEDITTREVWVSELSEPQREEIRQLIRKSEAAWLAQDFPRFASGWDFDFLDRFPRIKQAAPGIETTGESRRTRWKGYVENLGRTHVSSWRSWKSEIVSGMAVRSVLNLGSLPKTASDVFRIDTKAQFTRADGSTKQVHGTYYLVQQGQSYRIVHWDQGLSQRDFW